MITRGCGDGPGFGWLELPLVLLVLAFSGFVIALMLNEMASPLPWYAWPASFLVLPVGAAIGMRVFGRGGGQHR